MTSLEAAIHAVSSCRHFALPLRSSVIGWNWLRDQYSQYVGTTWGSGVTCLGGTV